MKQINILTLLGGLILANSAIASPTVSGDVITFPSDPGWYQVQRPDWSSVCEGAPGQSCTDVAAGTYIVTNLNTRERWEDIVVRAPVGGGGTVPAVNGSTMEMPSTSGWYQVQRPDWSPVCEAPASGSCEDVAAGSYIVTNLSNGDRWFDITVGGGDGGNGDGCHSRSVNSATPLREIIESCDFPRQGFLLGIAVKDNFGSSWMDQSVFGCLRTTSLYDQNRYGDCINGPEAGNVLAHHQVGKREFNIITAEAKQKFAQSQPVRPANTMLGGSNLDAGFRRDGMVDLMKNLGVTSGEVALHGHTLAFESPNTGSVIPDWFRGLSSQEARAVMKDRVERELRFYRDKNVAYWDVVNEFLPAASSEITDQDLRSFRLSPSTNMDLILKQGLFREKLGANWIELMFTWARDELDSWGPNAKKPDLIVNEVYVLWQTNKSEALYSLVQHLNRDRKLVDGVGFQGHLYDTYPSATAFSTIGQNMAKFTRLGINIYVTEFDVRLSAHQRFWSNDTTFTETPITATENRVQSARYRSVLSHCLNLDACKAFQIWGLTDRFSWVPSQAHLFSGFAIPQANGNYTFAKKAAYHAVNAELRSRLR